MLTNWKLITLNSRKPCSTLTSSGSWTVIGGLLSEVFVPADNKELSGCGYLIPKHDITGTRVQMAVFGVRFCPIMWGIRAKGRYMEFLVVIFLVNGELSTKGPTRLEFLLPVSNYSNLSIVARTVTESVLASSPI